MNTPNPYAPPRANVYDVNTASGEVPADRGTRLVAVILDGLIFFAMVYLPLIIGGAVSGAMAGAIGGAMNVAALFGIGSLFALVGLGVWIWLTVKFVNANGQSIAKKMLGIKVVRTDGTAVSLGRLFWLRNFVNGLLGLIPLYGLVDALLIFGEPRQCIHDKLADTIVIKA
jgi:uncharacterized RDD family membrane protein YckC